MDNKVFTTLELNKVLDRVGQHTAFSGGLALVASLTPATDIETVSIRQQETGEARTLLDLKPEITLGGTRDIRQQALDAERDIVLTPESLLDIKATLQAGAVLKRTLLRLADDLPLLAGIAGRIDEGRAIVAEVERILGPRGEVLDSASEKLGATRREMRREHDRLHTKLQSIISRSGNAPYLQENIVTMRGGRYVIPVKAEHKGRFKGIVHDQSSSGATLFIEPLATVEINNHLRQLELDEEEEIHRILAEASALVGEHAPEIIETVNALAALDLAFARAHYANSIDATQPELIDLDGDLSGNAIRLYGARHPLLDPASVVPIDVEMDGDVYTLVITGPNTGGKTVSLKTVGLLALMSQCGLHIPADEGSALPVFETIFADIGDEQSIEQSLSTFSGHMTHIISILQQADGRSLVILDELGAGTDPAEGSALARAILAELLSRGTTALIATHYPELKAYAHSTPGVRNASVEFSMETLAPTYRLLIGLPGRSNALPIASRLGLPDDLVNDARSMVAEDDLQIEDMLEEIDRTRHAIGQTQDRLEASHADANLIRDDLRERLQGIEVERRQILEAVREEAHAEIESLRIEISELREQMQAAALSMEDIESIDEQVAVLEEVPVTLPELEPIEPSVPEAEEEPDERELQIGDRVFVAGLEAEGEIVGLAGDKAELQLGNIRLRAAVEQLTWRSSPQHVKDAPAEVAVTVRSGDSPGIELHLRGQRVDDALDTLDRYLDRAYMAGLPWVRIVHGKGTGRLRSAVREALGEHALVQSFEQAEEREGGSGVTVVWFVAG